MEYVEQRDGGYYVAGTRVSLDSVVIAFLRGESPEEIVESFSALTKIRVKRAIDYYLTNRVEVDAYLAKQAVRSRELAAEARAKNPRLYEKLERAREQALSRNR